MSVDACQCSRVLNMDANVYIREYLIIIVIRIYLHNGNRYRASIYSGSPPVDCHHHLSQNCDFTEI